MRFVIIDFHIKSLSSLPQFHHHQTTTFIVHTISSLDADAIVIVIVVVVVPHFSWEREWVREIIKKQEKKEDEEMATGDIKIMEIADEMKEKKF